MGKIRNQGSASLEATLVMPVFLLAMVSLFWMAQSVLAEAQVYEAAAETAEYMAEIAYLGAADTAVAYLRFPKYADEKETVERYVKHGVSGVQFLGSEIGEKYIVLRVSYAMEHLVHDHLQSENGHIQGLHGKLQRQIRHMWRMHMYM